VIQRVGFVLLAPGPTQTQFLDTLIILANCVAIGACFAAALRGHGVPRIFWLLFGSAFLLQLVAGVSWAFIHYFQLPVAAPALFPSLFYRLYAGPMAIALFLSEDSRTSKLEAFFNGCIIVGLVGLIMLQLQLAELGTHDQRIWQLISIGAGVNFVLILGAVARFVFSSRSDLRGLFAIQAIYLSIYAGVALVTSVGEAYFPDIDASIDPIWIVIYLAGAVLAITWHPLAEAVEPPKPRISRRVSLLCFNLTLATMVLGCTVLGLLVVNSTRIVALLAIGVVLGSYAIRGALMQDNQETYLAELQESRAQMLHQALYDELTGLPNRRHFAERLSQALALSKRLGYRVGLLYFDLDGFKAVNDRLGHAVGDTLMSQAATRMLGRVRRSDTLARMGGDEFTLLLAHVTNKEQAEAVARDLLSTLAEPFHIEGHMIEITASIGIGIFPEDAQDGSGLVRQADSAMYAAKRDGGNGVRFYTPELES
jgi:diguanylate cyclase (GGDEF)-like protein